MQYKIQRYNMVQQQIRPWQVWDERVLKWMAIVPREKYVPEACQSFAYSDIEVSIGEDQTMLAPKLVARLLQALQLKGHGTVLEIGTGTGYMTALLSHLADHVTTIEINKNLMAKAKQNLENVERHNVEFMTDDAMKASNITKKFDGIILTGAVKKVPDYLFDLLNISGRLVAILGDAKAKIMQVALYQKKEGQSSLIPTILFETWVTPLIHAGLTSDFQF